MRIQQNMDVQNNIIKNQAGVNSASKSTHNNKNSVAVSGATLNENSPLSQRQSLAKKQALKVVSDAFGGEKKLDAQMQGIKRILWMICCQRFRLIPITMQLQG